MTSTFKSYLRGEMKLGNTSWSYSVKYIHLFYFTSFLSRFSSFIIIRIVHVFIAKYMMKRSMNTSKYDRYIDPTKSRDNLHSYNKIKFLCPFTRLTKIRSSPFSRGVDLGNSLRVEHHRAENKQRFNAC